MGIMMPDSSEAGMAGVCVHVIGNTLPEEGEPEGLWFLNAGESWPLP